MRSCETAGEPRIEPKIEPKIKPGIELDWNIVIWILLIAIIASWLPQATLVAGYIWRLRRWREPLIGNAQAPEALVVLCLRGGDPFLPRCIAGLMSQDYPRYRVRFVVDHPSDPALPILQQALSVQESTGQASTGQASTGQASTGPASTGPANVSYEIVFLQTPHSTCGLKCSSLAQAIRTDTLYAATGEEFVALLDADTIPHTSWLRELATALQKPAVGAVTGNRWYIPDQPSMPALVRRAWNSAAIVQMYFYSIAWGGTLAIKIRSLHQAGLLDRWTQALCEDTMTSQQLARIGQRLEFVPGLLMVNREDCSFEGLIPWMRRQLLTTRLYHYSWPAVVFHGVTSALILLGGWAIVAAYLLAGARINAALVAGMMVTYQIALSGLLIPLGYAVESIITARGESTVGERPTPWWRSALSVIVTQCVYTYALLTCLFVRQVQWRGIAYRVSGAWSIQMLDYQPYQSPEATSQQSL